METPSGDKGRLGGKFEGYTHTPQDDMWARIAAGQAGAQGRGRFAGLFAAYQHKPHARVWRAIAHTLQPQRRRIVLLRWSVAASLALLLGWGFYQWQSGPEDGATAATAFAAHTTSLPASQDRVVNCGQVPSLSADDLRNLVPVQAHVPFYPGFHKVFVGPGDAQPKWAIPGNDAPQAPGPQLDGPSPALDSSAMAVQHLTPIDSFITEVFPEIEFPQGDEAENALALSLGGSLFPSNGSVSRGGGGFNALLDRNNADQAFESLSNGLGVVNNSADAFSVSEDYQTPLSIGFFADLPLSRRWSAGLGATYTAMRSTVPDGSKVNRQYLGFGTRATFAFINGKRVRCYALSGLQADFGIDASFQAITASRIVPTSDFKAGNHLSAQFGVGTDFALTPHLGLYGQFAASSYLLQSHTNLWTQRAVWPTTQVGLRLKL